MDVGGGVYWGQGAIKLDEQSIMISLLCPLVKVTTSNEKNNKLYQIMAIGLYKAVY